MKKVLIVEDDQIVANIYRNKFSIDGFQVEVALDGSSGLEMARDFRPDAIVLDLMMPKMSGVDFMKKIRAQPDFEQLPVIVFSNTYLTNMVQEAWKAGATRCLSKTSCTPKQVVDVVRNSLSTNGGPTHANGTPNGTSAPQTATPASNSAWSSSPTPDAAGDADAQFQAEIRQEFLDGFPGLLIGARASLQGMVKGENESARLRNAQELYRRIHVLTGSAGIAGLPRIAQMSDALEALLKELYEKPKNINASSLRTVACSLDFLNTLYEQRIFPEQAEPAQANVLVVDDEAISRRAVTYALDKAKLKSVSLEDPVAAYEMLSQKKFDLIFLDVDMPGMNGFELCTKLRGLAGYKKTPVVFVTSLNDFESRANSSMSGGNDFIAKPFLFFELAVKALVYVFRAGLEAPK
jgi:DNA-binding response OmpR family regulator